MNGEDALTANGIDDKRKMEEIDDLQHKKYEEKDHSLVERMMMKICRLIKDRHIF